MAETEKFVRRVSIPELLNKIDQIPEGSLEKNSEEISFLSRFKAEISDADLSFLEEINQSDYWQLGTTSVIRNLKIRPLSSPEPVATFTGPKPQEKNGHEPIQTFGNIFCARTISTYPFQPQSDVAREGDPICDRYFVNLFENRLLFCVADGCNWGDRPRRAAEKAVTSSMSYLLEKQERACIVDDFRAYILRSFNIAHKNICRRSNPSDEPGTTTLISGICAPIETDAENSNWALTLVSVGDCKAFHICRSTGEIRDITEDNRAIQTHNGDCGGRLGPINSTGGPDLRNLSVYYTTCNPGDLIIVMSDGVHDNLHPRVLGLSPRDLKINYEWIRKIEDWEKIKSNSEVEAVSSSFRTKFLRQLLSTTGYIPSEIVNAVISHCVNATQSSRDWMHNNPGKRLPRDYVKFPGKMDHTTCVCFTVGKISKFSSCPTLPVIPSSASSSSSSSLSKFALSAPNLTQLPDVSHSGGSVPGQINGTSFAVPVGTHLEEKLQKQSYIPIAVTLTYNSTHLIIYCRTLAKGKFECLAKSAEITLSVIPPSVLQLTEEETVLHGFDDLKENFSRKITLPPSLRVKAQSQRVSYKQDVGIITIKFELDHEKIRLASLQSQAQ